jgi:hypothetical protein
LEGMRRLFASNHVMVQVELTAIEKLPVTDFFNGIGHRAGPCLDLDHIFYPA